MIIVGGPATPPVSQIRILRVITVDHTGDERWWNYDDLREAHPELFSSDSSRTVTLDQEPPPGQDVF